MLETTRILLEELYLIDAPLAHKMELAIFAEREVGYQEGWNGHDNWIGI